MSYTQSLLFKVNALQIKDFRYYQYGVVICNVVKEPEFLYTRNVIRSNINILHKLLLKKNRYYFMSKCLY